MIVAPASAGSSLILSAMAKPSIPGMLASRITRPKGARAFFASFIMSSAERPPSAKRRFMRQPLSMSASRLRFVALSSATSTGRFSRFGSVTCGGALAGRSRARTGG